MFGSLLECSQQGLLYGKMGQVGILQGMLVVEDVIVPCSFFLCQVSSSDSCDKLMRSSLPAYVRAHPNAQTFVRPGPSSHTHSQDGHVLMRRLPEQSSLDVNYLGKKNYMGPRARSSVCKS
jgi:hypothetical protein